MTKLRPAIPIGWVGEWRRDGVGGMVRVDVKLATASYVSGSLMVKT